MDFSSQSALTIGQFSKADAITFFVRFKGASVTKTVKSRNDVAISPPSDSTFLLKAFTWRGLNPELNSTRCVKVTPHDSFVVFCDFFALLTAIFVVGSRFFFSPLVFLAAADVGALSSADALIRMDECAHTASVAIRSVCISAEPAMTSVPLRSFAFASASVLSAASRFGLPLAFNSAFALSSASLATRSFSSITAKAPSPDTFAAAKGSYALHALAARVPPSPPSSALLLLLLVLAVAQRSHRARADARAPFLVVRRAVVVAVASPRPVVVVVVVATVGRRRRRPRAATARAYRAPRPSTNSNPSSASASSSIAPGRRRAASPTARDAASRRNNPRRRFRGVEAFRARYGAAPARRRRRHTNARRERRRDRRARPSGASRRHGGDRFRELGQRLAPVKHVTVQDVAETALARGFARPGIDASKPIARRADLDGFFRMFSVNSLSNFKRVFALNALRAPSVGGEVFVEEREREVEEEVTWACPAVEEYEKLAKSWDKEHVHKWRMLPKPGGAVCRPDDWYALHAAKQQAEKGDCVGEKPMWASHGGIAYDDRERWDFWNKLKGLSREDAKKKFCEAYGRAMLAERESLNFRKY